MAIRYSCRVLVFFSLVCCGRIAAADNFQWVVPPGSPATAWQTPAAWNNLTTPGPGIPGAADSALFTDTGCCSLSSVTLLPVPPPAGNVTVQKLTFDSGIYDLAFPIPAQSISVTGSDQFIIGQGTHAAEVSLGSSAPLGIINANGSFIGKDSGSVGILNLANGATYSETGSIRVGEFGVGSLNVSSGATATTTGRMFVASLAAGNGHVSVHGGTIQTGQEIFLGSGGFGDLLVDSGGSVSCATVPQIGFASGSVGVATVSGAGSILQAGWYMNIGRAGQGTVYVTNGGTLQAVSYFDIAPEATGVGTVSVTGNGSKMLTNGGVNVGSLGQGTLTVSNGGELSAGGSITAAFSGSGTITIESGATASALNGLFLGYYSTGKGTVKITGANSSVSAVWGLLVGYGDGYGNLIVENGGKATTPGQLILGSNASATGETSVQGTNSKIESTLVNVGQSGRGLLTVGSGGLVSTTGDLNIASNLGSQGTVNINIGGTITVGAGVSTFVGGWAGGVGGTGVLNVDTGGSLNIGNELVIWNAGSNKVNLTGGTINTAALNFKANPSRFNWISGTLNINNNVTFYGPAGTTTSTAFGPARSLGAGQTLKVTGNEQLGGPAAFALTVNSGGKNVVTGTLTVTQIGTLAVNTGGSVTVGDSLFALSNSTVNLAGGGTITIGDVGATVPAARSVLVGTGGRIYGYGSATFLGDVVNNSGAVRPVGQWNYTGKLSQATAGTLEIELRGTSRGTGYDAIVATGQASLGGSLQVTLGAFSPALNDSFDILDASGITGTFSTLTLPALGSGLIWNTSALYTSGVLSVTAGVLGDYNNNGAVDAADYILWRKGGPLANEVDAPGTVNGADYTEWRARFGNPGSGSGLGAAGFDSAVVPEPATLVFAILAFSAIALPFGRQPDRTSE